jgi:hypothetical protein
MVNASNQLGNGVATTASNPISFGCHLIFSRHGWGLDARQDLVVMPWNGLVEQWLCVGSTAAPSATKWGSTLAVG